MAYDSQTVKARFQAAVDRLAARLEEDYYVLAAVLYGSVARGEPWERSDIDLIIVLRDGQERSNRNLWLVEDDLNVSAELVTRGNLKRELESVLQGSMFHSIRSQFRLLFSKDETITAWLSEPAQIGRHDQQLQLLRTSAEVFWTLDKAEKWFYVKHDLPYSLMWILYTVNALARIEVVQNGEAPGREALDQALRFNPQFFTATYIDLINGPKTEERLAEALARINAYLEERTQLLFGPVLDYLSQADGLCTAAEMNAFFRKKVQAGDLTGVYEYLARRGIIQKLASPLHLTRKSQVTMDEPAYYYDKVDLTDWE
jgi:predicted nucleotidyltransferase